MPRSKSDTHVTPPEFRTKMAVMFAEGGRFSDFDPCPSGGFEDPNVRDGLSYDWDMSGDVFVNPPYSRLHTTHKNGKGWIQKCWEEAQRGRRVVMLVFSTITSTVAFHKYCYNVPNVRLHFVKGRLRFNNASPSPKPSMVVVFDPPP